MRVLHVSDTHLGAAGWARGAPPGWSRADDHLAAFRRALCTPADLIVHTGDVFDRSRPPARAVREAVDLLVETARRVPVVLLAGNHDRRGLRPSLPTAAAGLLRVHDRADLDQVGPGVLVRAADGAERGQLEALAQARGGWCMGRPLAAPPPPPRPPRLQLGLFGAPRTG